MTTGDKNNFIKEILTSISLTGCFLNILSLAHDLYIFSNKDYLFEYVYLITISVTTVLCMYGIFKLKEGKTEGFKYYLSGQSGEFIFYCIVFFFKTIPEYNQRVEIDSLLASVGFIKNILPLLTMTLLHYLFPKKLYPLSDTISS
jgi:hypothetical protein